MVDVLVEHDYTAKEPNELSITKGDIIRDVVQKQGGWWEGTLNDKKGLFPDNFVKIIDKESVVMRNRKDVARIRKCRVIFSYKKEHDDELNLNVGDVIDILGEEEEGWWRGTLNGKEGVFPSNFVKEIKLEHGSKENITENNSVSPTLPAKPPEVYCKVKYSYKAQNDDELTLKEGDIIVIISKEGQDQGWWRGKLNDQIGVFPDNFVEIINEPQTEEKKNQKVHHHHHYENNEIKTNKDAQKKLSEDLTVPESTSASTLEIDKAKVTPPVPGKKPSIPVKKSPSSSGGSGGGGLLYGLKKKIADVVDGATSSKAISPPKTETPTNMTASENSDNIFDDVVRRPILSDVRASRPKVRGRRPPSSISKDVEYGITNGNTEQLTIDLTMEQTTELDGGGGGGVGVGVLENKPKLREWEKNKAPWLEEMKINQAKRISPGPPEARLKLTPTDKDKDKDTELSTTPPQQQQQQQQNKFIDLTSPETTKPLAAFNNNKLKTSPSNEFDKPLLRTKTVPTMPTRPQTIQNINLSESKAHLKVTPLNRTPSPLQKPPSQLQQQQSDKVKDKRDSFEGISQKQYLELMDRIIKLEDIVEQLKEKLKIETEMRIALQAKVEQL